MNCDAFDFFILQKYELGVEGTETKTYTKFSEESSKLIKEILCMFVNIIKLAKDSQIEINITRKVGEMKDIDDNLLLIGDINLCYNPDIVLPVISGDVSQPTQIAKSAVRINVIAKGAIVPIFVTYTGTDYVNNIEFCTQEQMTEYTTSLATAVIGSQLKSLHEKTSSPLTMQEKSDEIAKSIKKVSDVIATVARGTSQVAAAPQPGNIPDDILKLAESMAQIKPITVITTNPVAVQNAATVPIQTDMVVMPTSSKLSTVPIGTNVSVVKSHGPSQTVKNLITAVNQVVQSQSLPEQAASQLVELVNKSVRTASTQLLAPSIKNLSTKRTSIKTPQMSSRYTPSGHMLAKTLPIAEYTPVSTGRTLTKTFPTAEYTPTIPVSAKTLPMAEYTPVSTGRTVTRTLPTAEYTPTVRSAQTKNDLFLPSQRNSQNEQDTEQQIAAILNSSNKMTQSQLSSKSRNTTSMAETSSASMSNMFPSSQILSRTSQNSE